MGYGKGGGIVGQEEHRSKGERRDHLRGGGVQGS